MSVLMVPRDQVAYPSLGGQVCAWIEENLVHGPGDLLGMPVRFDQEKRALIYRMYEVYPPGHVHAGRRRFKRCALSLRKGVAKTELAALIAAVELHPEGPVRCDGFDARGQPVGCGVTDPYIPLVAYTEEQSDELAYGALKVILEHSLVADDFDIGIERIMRIGGDGKAVSLASSPDARDGARTTFQVCDEPLAVDTPVPTPIGWTTIGEIQPGDFVFGSDGRPLRVDGCSPIHSQRPCYEIIFGDGSSVTADENHLWTVYDHSPSFRCWRTVTTKFIYEHRWAHARRFVLPPTCPLNLPVVELPVDPYVFGLWLGDGDSANAVITAGKEDVEEIEASVRACGYVITRLANEGAAPRFYVTFANSSMSGWGATRNDPKNHSVIGEFRKLDVLKNKHIPVIYLRSSIDQRLALLQGLMDSDGYTDRDGHCTFSNNNERLIEDVRELLHSLGYTTRKSKQIDRRWAEEKTQYRVQFTARGELLPFRLHRKVTKITLSTHPQQKNRSIRSVRPTTSLPVRCLEVGSNDHLFLVGRSMFPTHNTHRWNLPRLKQAHRTMLANIPKRRMADAWSLEVTTAPAPGEGSVAEDTMDYARQVSEGAIQDSRLFFFHRQASDGHDLSTAEGIRAAVIEASGPAAEWSDIDGIVEQWRDPTADKTYLERVWLNRMVRASERAFDVELWKSLALPDFEVPKGETITLGFDGARWRDATALVGTHVRTGFQWIVGLWERPANVAEWEVPNDEVEATVEEAFTKWRVWRMYCDPPYWETQVAGWAGRWGEEKVVEWWTNRMKTMAYAIKSFNNAMLAREISHDGGEAYARHIGNAVRHRLNMVDEDGTPLWIIYKERADSPHKIDAAMAGILSWRAYQDALTAGATGTSVYDGRGIREI